VRFHNTGIALSNNTPEKKIRQRVNSLSACQFFIYGNSTSLPVQRSLRWNPAATSLMFE
jgi:hypothetical protein